MNKFGKLVIGIWLLFGYWYLVIGVLPVCALNFDNLKIYFLKGDYKAAITEGEKILAHSEESDNLDELYYILGLSYLKDGNYLRASDIFEIIVKEFKNSPFRNNARLGLGDTYFLKGDYAKAKEEYSGLINNKPSAELVPLIYYRLSQIESRQDNIQEAKRYSDKIKQDYPLNMEIKFNSDFAVSDLYYTVQVGAFSNRVNAQNLTQKLTQKGYPAYLEEAVSKDEKTYRVRVGKVSSRKEAEELENKLLQEGYPTKIYP